MAIHAEAIMSHQLRASAVESLQGTRFHLTVESRSQAAPSIKKAESSWVTKGSREKPRCPVCSGVHSIFSAICLIPTALTMPTHTAFGDYQRFAGTCWGIIKKARWSSPCREPHL